MSPPGPPEPGEAGRPALPPPTTASGEWIDVYEPPPPEWRAASRVKLLAGSLILGLLVAVSLLSPPFNPYAPSEALLMPPQWWAGPHPLGTDLLGRDVVSRLMIGARLLLARCLALVILVWFGTLALRCLLTIWRRDPFDGSTPFAAISVVLIGGIVAEVVYGVLGLQQLDRLGLLGFLAFGARPVLSAVEPSLGSLAVEGQQFGLGSAWPLWISAFTLLLAALGVGLLGSGMLDLAKRSRWETENLDERGNQRPAGRAWREQTSWKRASGPADE